MTVCFFACFRILCGGKQRLSLSALLLFSTKNHLFLQSALLELFKNNEKSLHMIRFLPAAAGAASGGQAGDAFLCGRA